MSETSKFASVFFLSSSMEISELISVNKSPFFFTSNTAKSVIILLTTPFPVIGKEHYFSILLLPLLFS